jgi:hypothetical protein
VLCWQTCHTAASNIAQCMEGRAEHTSRKGWPVSSLLTLPYMYFGPVEGAIVFGMRIERQCQRKDLPFMALLTGLFETCPQHSGGVVSHRPQKKKGKGLSEPGPEAALVTRQKLTLGSDYIINEYTVPKYFKYLPLTLTSSIPHYPVLHAFSYCHLDIYIRFEWVVLFSFQCRTTSGSTIFMEHKLWCWNTCKERHSFTAVRKPPMSKRASNIMALARDRSRSLPSNLVYCHR